MDRGAGWRQGRVVAGVIRGREATVARRTGPSRGAAAGAVERGGISVVKLEPSEKVRALAAGISKVIEDEQMGDAMQAVVGVLLEGLQAALPVAMSAQVMAMPLVEVVCLVFDVDPHEVLEPMVATGETVQ
jgi:hypothetical protein